MNFAEFRSGNNRRGAARTAGAPRVSGQMAGSSDQCDSGAGIPHLTMRGAWGEEEPGSKRESVVKMVGVVVVATGRFRLGIVAFLLPLVEFFVHPVLKEPDWISIPSDELVNWQAINCGRPPDALLLPVDEDRHEFTPAAFLFRLLCGTKFSFWLPHDSASFLLLPMRLPGGTMV